MNINIKVLLSPGKSIYIEGKGEVQPRKGCEGPWGGRGEGVEV